MSHEVEVPAGLTEDEAIAFIRQSVEALGGDPDTIQVLSAFDDEDVYWDQVAEKTEEIAGLAGCERKCLTECCECRQQAIAAVSHEHAQRHPKQQS